MTDRYVEPDWFTRNVFNRVVALLTRLGLSVWGSRVLEVRGRTSGLPRRTPVNMLTLDGARFLVAPRGHTHWVRNLRAAGEGRLLIGIRAEPFRATEVPDDAKERILGAYLKRWKWEVGTFFGGVGADSPSGELRRIAPDHPVFRIETVRDGPDGSREAVSAPTTKALALVALAGVLAGASGCGSQSPPPSARTRERPSIRILDWSVIGSAVTLEVKITGWKMAPPRRGTRSKARTGQWQIFADDLYTGFSYDRSYGAINGLAAGTYQIWVALARTDYSLVYPLIRSRPVTVRVGDDRLLTG